eukprot:s2982_g4.t1
MVTAQRLAATPRFVALEVHSGDEEIVKTAEAVEIIDIPGRLAALIPYVVSALAKEWRPEPAGQSHVETVQAGNRICDLQTQLGISFLGPMCGGTSESCHILSMNIHEPVSYKFEL